MEKNKKSITKKGFEILKDELKNLINIARPKVIEAIKEARKHGDLSENAEYNSARDEQGIIESRISEIEAILNEAIVVKKDDDTIVSVGNIITFKNVSTNQIEKYEIVSEYEIDPLNNKISDQCLLVNDINNNIKSFKNGKEIKINAKISYKIINGKIL